MAKGRTTLGEFELLTLAAVLLAGDNAYGVVIHEQAEGLAAGIKPVSLSAVYTTLYRLEQKGYLKSNRFGSTPEGGGWPRRFFGMTSAGELAIRNSVGVLRKVLNGLARFF